MPYKYGMKRRGYSIGCQPTGVIKFEDVDKKETGYYSIITYLRELTDKEIEEYELEKL